MKYELRRNHAGASRIFTLGETTAYEGVLLGEENPHTYPYLIATVEAGSWLEAKRAFALPMSEIQTKLANGTITHFELFGHSWETSPVTPRRKP